MSVSEFERRLEELRHSIRVERTMGFKVYNLDKGRIQELSYPDTITMSDETDRVVEMRRKAEAEHDRKRASLLMDVAQDEVAKDPVMRASSQVEGGFFVVADPNEVAFFECRFKPPRPGMTRKEVEEYAEKLGLTPEEMKKHMKENFGFSCRPVTMGMIGGPENWLYGHYFDPRRCEQVYDRETGRVIPKPPDEKFVMYSRRYYCGCHEDEIEDYKEKWKHALEKLREYDDLIRFSERQLKGVSVSKMWDVEEKLMERLKETTDEHEVKALGKLMEHFLKRKDSYQPSEEFRKLFIKRYGEIV